MQHGLLYHQSSANSRAWVPAGWSCPRLLMQAVSNLCADCLHREAHHAAIPRSRVMLTIHNLYNAGECRQDDFAFTGKPDALPPCTQILAHQNLKWAMHTWRTLHHAGLSEDAFATVDRALNERTIGHNPERLSLMKGGHDVRTV